MVTILEKNNFVKTVLGAQKHNDDNEYRLLHFCIIKKIGNDTVLYNNLTKVLFLLTSEEVCALEKLPGKVDECIVPFVENWCLVPVNNDDCKIVEQVFAVNSLYKDNSFIDSYIILTTTDCNARCFYCYEHGVTRTHMSEQTASDVADYIIKNSKGNPVSIKWFGGEPLYNDFAIDIICNRLIENNIEFASRMTSNGYLFNEENIKRAVELWHLKSVQITLDGTEDVYNKIKAYIYKDDLSPFKIVISNIEKLLLANIKVSVRVNVSDNNRDDIYNLIDYIKERFPNEENLSVYNSNLFDLDNTRSVEESIRLNEEYFKMNRRIIELKLNKYTLERWATLRRGCMAQEERSVVISPKGLLGKCEHFSEGELMFGSIYDTNVNQAAIDYWLKFNRINECSTCIAYPNCYGENNCPNNNTGCLYGSLPIKLYTMEQDIIQEYRNYKASLKDINN